MRNIAVMACAALALISVTARAETSDLDAFKSGATGTYSSSGHSPAAKVSVTFKYPSTWGLIQNTQASGLGASSADKHLACIVLIQENAQFSEAQFKPIFAAPEQLKGFLPAGSEYVSGNSISLAGRAAGEIVFKAPASTPGNPILVSMDDFVAVDGAVVSFQCMAADTTAASASARFDAALPLFRLMAASIDLKAQ